MEWVYTPEGPETSLRSGKVDLWPLLGDLPERRKFLYISEPWFTQSFWMISLESSNISTPTDTVGREVWVELSSVLSSRIAKVTFPNARLVTAPSYEKLLEGVCLGKADAAMIWATTTVESDFRKVQGCENVGLRFCLLPHGNVLFGIGASRRRPGADKAADAIQKQIRKLTVDGTLSAIYFKWFRDPRNETTVIYYLTEARRRNVYMGVAICGLLVLFELFAWQTVQVRRARRVADASNEAKSQFLANMSHEIRTPLNGVIGMTDLALETELSNEQREYLDTVKISADSLLTVINDILDFSKMEAGKVDLEILNFSLRESIEDTLKTLSVRADEKGLELMCEVGPEVPEMVSGDVHRLRQVLVNLVGNAIKFTAEGEVAVKVQAASVKAGEGLLEFIVSDTGIGISPEKKKSIFDPFSQADASTTRKYGGTGLGLTISTRLVGMMGGTIWVEGEMGRGSQFHFTTRLGVAEGPAIEIGATAPPEILRGVKVLVVDDNRTNRRILEGMLKRWEMTSASVEGGKEALKELGEALGEGNPFGLILTDMHMPDMDGFELIAQIRRLPELSAAVIMMLTSAGHRGRRGALPGIGCVRVLTETNSPIAATRSHCSSLGP
ncbi:MAG: hypothetical protein NVS9B4_11480 [Candidatus Acidiferrum sp.]